MLNINPQEPPIYNHRFQLVATATLEHSQWIINISEVYLSEYIMSAEAVCSSVIFFPSFIIINNVD